MDAEAALAAEGYADLCEMRDNILRQVQQCAATMQAKADQLALGNRQQRRKAEFARAKIRKFEAWFSGRVDQEFKRLAGGYRPDAAVFGQVQLEAAEKLAAIFS